MTTRDIHIVLADSDGERRDINGAFILATYSDGREVHLYGRRNGFAYAAFTADLTFVFKVPSHWVADMALDSELGA